MLSNFTGKRRSFNRHEYIIYWLTAAFIFLGAFPHTTAIRNFCFYLAALLFLYHVFVLRKVTVKTPLLIPFALYLGWSLFACIFAKDPLDSLKDIHSHLLIYVIYYLILVNFFRSRNDLIFLSRIITFASAIFSLGAIIHFYFILGNPFSMRLGQELGHLYSTNVIGFMLVFSLILALHNISIKQVLVSKVLLYASALSVVVAGILTQSRSTIIVLILSLFACPIPPLTKKKNALLILFLILTSLLTLTSFQKDHWIFTGAFGDRITSYLYSIEILKESPITGTGFALDVFESEDPYITERYGDKIPMFGDMKYPFIWPPHNIILNISVRTGIPGLLSYLFILVTFASTCLRLYKTGKDNFVRRWAFIILTALIIFMIKAMLEPATFHYTDLIFYTILGMGTIIGSINRSLLPPEKIVPVR